MSTRKLLFVSLILAAACSARAQPPRLSDDRDLTDRDLSTWECLHKLDGSAKTADGQERNRGKNRSVPDLKGLTIPDLDTGGLLKLVEPFNLLTIGKRRKDIGVAERTQMESLEKQIVSLTGYLVLAYAGPPETTNCASVDFHDWHLEVFEKPSDHPPRVGDPTPIICEITPRTLKGIYQAGIRLVDMAAFMRRPDLSYEPTGYLLWDDEHNGKADVGSGIESFGSNGFHHPWRSSAWELHPVFKIEVLDSATGGVPPAMPITAPLPAASATPTVILPTAGAVQQTVVTLEPVKIKIPYGETVLPRGMQFKLLSRDAQSVTVRYMETTVRLPLKSVEIR